MANVVTAHSTRLVPLRERARRATVTDQGPVDCHACIAGRRNCTDGVLRISWRYLNAYGNVPQRDDVRFDLAIKDTPVPPNGRLPPPATIPAGRKQSVRLRLDAPAILRLPVPRQSSEMRHTGTLEVHRPVASTNLREYRIDVPASCDR